MLEQGIFRGVERGEGRDVERVDRREMRVSMRRRL